MKTRMFTKLLAATVMAVSLMACANGSDDGEDSESSSYTAKGSSAGSSNAATGGSGTASFVRMNAGTGTSVTFSMGCEAGDDKEKPVHSVTLTRNFSICDHEVTQAEYTAVMGTNPSKYTGDDTLPVEKVSWYDALVYCNRRSMTEGLTPCYTISGSSVACDFDANGYRLPTEAEWEYAARAGDATTDSMVWSGTTAESSLGDYAWYFGNSTSNGSRTTHPVKSKQPNAKGLYDMSGNVEEWCWDWYHDNYYRNCSYEAGGVENPTGASASSCSNPKRVVRGGSFQRPAASCSVSFRFSQPPDTPMQAIGFRVCRTVPAE